MKRLLEGIERIDNIKLLDIKEVINRLKKIKSNSKN